MTELQKLFIKDSEHIAFDLEHRKKLYFNISRYDENVLTGKQQFSDLELARRRAANLKHKIINDLDKYLVEFEINFEKHGGKVIWAVNERDAVKEVLSILKKHKINLVVKSKSIITEELEINEALEKKKIEAIETDLGEYIVQLAGEKPYHILTPAMHKSKEDVARLFHEHYGTPEDALPPEITAFVRNLLREKFLTAGAGITGANFLIADTGSICLTENEGNAFMCTSFPKVHIVITGIEKLIPSIMDLNLFWPLLSTLGTGQHITTYNHVISGPRKEGELDGPDEMYVILLENRRSEVLREERPRRALSCIRCGACLNACPVYKTIGGYTYNCVYTGPVGSVITPYLENMKDFKHLSFASSLCGRCTEVCPVKIPLHELLLVNRNEAVLNGYSSRRENIIFKNLKRVLLRRNMMNVGSARLKNALLRRFFAKTWGPHRELPVLQPKSFNKLWKEQHNPRRKPRQITEN
jgi:L-lactate dehydrogenase complex protein LldF